MPISINSCIRALRLALVAFELQWTVSSGHWITVLHTDDENWLQLIRKNERNKKIKQRKKLCHSFDIDEQDDDDDNFASNENCVHWWYDTAQRDHAISRAILTNELTTAIVHINLCGAFYCHRSRRQLLLLCVCVRRNLAQLTMQYAVLRSATEWSKFKLFKLCARRKPDTNQGTEACGGQFFSFFIFSIDRAICDILNLQIIIISSECNATNWRKRGTAAIAAGHLIVKTATPKPMPNKMAKMFVRT